MSDQFESNDATEALESLETRMDEFEQQCLFRSAARVASELKRLAKAEREAGLYMRACFNLMNQSEALLDPQPARDAAVEMIGLVESEDRARAIEPNLREEMYSHCVHFYSACAYDNLAETTSEINGYNSEGMHQCITDGIHVCQRTGKLQCVKCFREYGTDVYRAADDLDMALHFARTGVAHEDPGPHDRRWVGAKDEAELLLLKGQLAESFAAAQRAWQLCSTYHSTRKAFLETRLTLLETAQLMGDRAAAERFLQTAVPAADVDLSEPPAGEFPWFEMRRDQVEAVADFLAGNYDEAIRKLTEWDRTLLRQQNLTEWFENRLRLIAAHRAAGNHEQVEALARQLAAKAKPARDWLTLRRLTFLVDATNSPVPVPATTAYAVSSQAGAGKPAGSEIDAAGEETSGEAAPGETAQAETSQAGGESREPPALIRACWARLYQDDDDSTATEAAVLTELLGATVETGEVNDVRWFLHTVRMVASDDPRVVEVWRWAEQLAAPHKQDAVVVSLLATLGASIRFSSQGEKLEEIITEQQLEAMFRESLDLDATIAKNFGRAGDFYSFMENVGEAERCYARGSRLDRTNADLASKLARVYKQTDRSRDALNVLDMCLREGCDDPNIAWQAAVTAFDVGQYAESLLYLDRFEQQLPDQPWVNYYRAGSLLELGRPADAIASTEEECRRNPDCPVPPLFQRVTALGDLGRVDEFRAGVQEILATRLTDTDLAIGGLEYVMTRLWKAFDCLPADDPLRVEFETRLLSAGLAHDGLFDVERQRGEAVSGLDFYQCTVHQPLDDRWADSPFRLMGEEDWTSYETSWGVLAASEDEASQAVLRWQSRCYPLPATVIEIEGSQADYTDKPGVVWQGYRYPGDPPDE